MHDTTVYLSNYQPPMITVLTIDLNFDLYDDHALVTNRMQLKRNHTGDVHLHGDGLALISVHLDNQLMSTDDYRLQGDDLIITSASDAFTLTIVTRIHPEKNTALSGLYRSNTLFCTQCEAQGFRRMTYFPDRPDVLATYTTRISADKERYPILLSNGNLVKSGMTDNGRHWVVWQDPFKKPSYLFALVAGNLVCVRDQFTTCSGRVVDLHIYVEPGNEDKCAHAMASLKKAMRWDETEYGREYDLDIFMIVAVSDFNMGAMENKGLNIFNAHYILARPDTATDDDYAGIESVVAHEYFHNWTGNRVTCRDWFQLSLKEGLTVFRDQEFSRDMNSREVNRILDVKTLRRVQFLEDAGPMAHPVRPSSYQEISNFYTATIYEKGAEVIRMQQTLLGLAGFRRGMDLYFQRHDGQAVTIDDFVRAMEDANGVDLTQFKRWYDKAGTPEVRVHSEYSEGQLTLSFTQTCRPTPECCDTLPFHMPIRIALFDASGVELPLNNPVLDLRETEQVFQFDGLSQKPIVSLLRDFSAPVRLIREETEAELLLLLRVERDGFSKWDVAQQLAIACLLRCYHAPEQDWVIPQTLLDVYHYVLLDESLDQALRAELLTPPGFEDLAGRLVNIDVERVEAVRDFFRHAVGRALYASACVIYTSLWAKEDHAMHGRAYGLRKLRNVLLSFMMKVNEAQTLKLCQQQFTEARTMTDQVASLALLINSSDARAAESAIDFFYRQWKDDTLVLDKWFSLQASADHPDVLSRVRALLLHPAFHLKNPNKVRALLSAFTHSNPRYFHALDGSGYVFLTEMLIKLDTINPQITARLVLPFSHWQRLDEPRQVLMKQQLERLSALDLSRDLREIVSKSLVLSSMDSPT